MENAVFSKLQYPFHQASAVHIGLRNTKGHMWAHLHLQTHRLRDEFVKQGWWYATLLVGMKRREKKIDSGWAHWTAMSVNYSGWWKHLSLSSHDRENRVSALGLARHYECCNFGLCNTLRTNFSRFLRLYFLQLPIPTKFAWQYLWSWADFVGVVGL